MLAYNENPHFSIRWVGPVMRLNFKYIDTSPIKTTEVVSAIRQAVQYSENPYWVEMSVLEDANVSSLALRPFFQIELEWKLRNGCAGIGICVPKDAVEATKMTFQSAKHGDLVKVFESGDADECLRWVKSRLPTQSNSTKKEKSEATI